jgi:hypothetical protein
MGSTRLMRSEEIANFFGRVLVFMYKSGRFLKIRSGRFCTVTFFA